MSFYDAEKEYNKYVDDVLAGRITVCNNIFLACQRYKSWFARDDYYFDYEDVDRKIRFVNKLKHWEGPTAGKNFLLLPWQSWVFANIFGWKRKDTKKRVIENVLIFVARKNGKSSLCAALALVTALCDNEAAPQIGIYANAGGQAEILFKMCKNYAESIDPKGKIFTRYRTELRIPANKGKIFCGPSNTKAADGANYHVFIQDEVHFQRDNKLYDVLKSSQQARTQPLAIQITTAGSLTVGYPLYEYRKVCVAILKGLVQDDSQFSAIYELDEDDDWTDEKVWIKANPSLGETVILDKLRTEVKRAKNNSAFEFGVRTKNFNEFINAADAWISDNYVMNSSRNIDLKMLKGEQCWVGVDLSSVGDLTAWSIVFPPNPKRKYYPDKFIFKSYVYVPGDEYENSVNYMNYRQWIKQGDLRKTPGKTVNYDYILKDQKEILQDFIVWGLFMDRWEMTYYQDTAKTLGFNVVEFSQGLQNFRNPTKAFEILIKRDDVVIDNNRCVRWCFSNCELKQDYNNNVKPDKAGGVRSKKIDPVITMVEALGAWMQSTRFTPKIFAI